MRYIPTCIETGDGGGGCIEGWGGGRFPDKDDIGDGGSVSIGDGGTQI